MLTPDGDERRRARSGPNRAMSLDSVPRIMAVVAVALVPGLLAQTAVYGLGVLAHVAVAVAVAVALEWALGQPGLRWCKAVDPRDGTALVTAVLVALAIPAGAAWWVVACAVAFGLGFGKHVYGGLGHNPFNPAMVAVAFALVAFPGEMIRWFSTPVAGADLAAWLLHPDAYGGATALDGARELRVAGREAAAGFLPKANIAIALAFTAGGVALLALGVIGAVLPLATVLGVAVCALVLGEEGRWFERLLWHIAGGATLLAAFFVVTDPVTAPRDRTAQWIIGLAVGAGIYVIRRWGNYPDGVAFAVLAANMSTPALEWLLGRRRWEPDADG